MLMAIEMIVLEFPYGEGLSTGARGAANSKQRVSVQ